MKVRFLGNLLKAPRYDDIYLAVRALERSNNVTGDTNEADQNLIGTIGLCHQVVAGANGVVVHQYLFVLFEFFSKPTYEPTFFQRNDSHDDFAVDFIHNDSRIMHVRSPDIDAFNAIEKRALARCASVDETFAQGGVFVVRRFPTDSVERLQRPAIIPLE